MLLIFLAALVHEHCKNEENLSKIWNNQQDSPGNTVYINHDLFPRRSSLQWAVFPRLFSCHTDNCLTLVELSNINKIETNKMDYSERSGSQLENR